MSSETSKPSTDSEENLPVVNITNRSDANRYVCVVSPAFRLRNNKFNKNFLPGKLESVSLMLGGKTRPFECRRPQDMNVVVMNLKNRKAFKRKVKIPNLQIDSSGAVTTIAKTEQTEGTSEDPEVAKLQRMVAKMTADNNRLKSTLEEGRVIEDSSYVPEDEPQRIEITNTGTDSIYISVNSPGIRARNRKRLPGKIDTCNLLRSGKTRWFEVLDPNDVSVIIFEFVAQKQLKRKKPFDALGIDKEGNVQIGHATNSTDGQSAESSTKDDTEDLEVAALQRQLLLLKAENKRLKSSNIKNEETASPKKKSRGNPKKGSGSDSNKKKHAKVDEKETAKWFGNTGGSDAKGNKPNDKPVNKGSKEQSKKREKPDPREKREKSDPREFISCVKMGKGGKVKTMLADGVDVNYEDDTGLTATMWASIYNRIDSIANLIDSKADLHKQSPKGDQAIHYAAKWGHVKIVQSLLDAGVDCNAAGELDRTPLMYAAHSGYYDTVKVLVANGANKKAKDAEGKLAVDYARTYATQHEKQSSV